MGFEELERDPLGEMARIYDQLRLPDFAVVRSDMERYLRSLAGYQKNVYPNLPVEVESEVPKRGVVALTSGAIPLAVVGKGKADGLAGEST